MAATIAACVTRPAAAVVVFEEDFTLRSQGTTIFNTAPNVVTTGSATYKRSDNLASGTEGLISFYGASPAPGFTGLDWHPQNLGTETLASSYAQNFTLPYNYTFGTDKVRLTVRARTYDPYDSDGISFWNNFSFGFTDTDRNLSNFVLLQRNPNNSNRTLAKIFHNGKIYQTNLPAPAVNAEYFRTLTLEYDPTKSNISGTSPYSLIVDSTTYVLRSQETLPNPSALDVGLPTMTTDGGQTYGNIKGIGVGLWFANETHPTGSNNYLPKSNLIESLKFETIAQTAPGVTGDFNNNGKVDAADYVIWRENSGTNNALANDGGLGTPIGAAHYNLWRQNFGNPPGAGAGGMFASEIPEPGSASLLLVVLIAGSASCRFRLARFRSSFVN